MRALKKSQCGSVKKRCIKTTLLMQSMYAHLHTTQIVTNHRAYGLPLTLLAHILKKKQNMLLLYCELPLLKGNCMNISW